MATELDLYDAMKSHIDLLQDEMYTSLPATVTSYNASNQSVEVQLDVRLSNILTGVEDPQVSLSEVPVMFPSGGGGILSFPISIGDKVLLCFTKYSIDKWKTGKEGIAGENRQHNVSDAVAICGLFNLTSNLEPNPKDVELKAFGTTITLKASGDVEITPAGITKIISDIEITGDLTVTGNAIVGGTVTATTDVKAGTISLKNHVHGGVTSGGSFTLVPS